jgi:hypothetical protein
MQNWEWNNDVIVIMSNVNVTWTSIVYKPLYKIHNDYMILSHGVWCLASIILINMQQIRDPIQIKKFINAQHPILILEH